MKARSRFLRPLPERACRALVGLGLAAVFAALSPAQAAVEPLPAISAATSNTTVSGISSGGYMAVQFQVSHSSIVRGAGVIAGGPFGCAEGSIERALGPCMEGAPDGAALADRLAALARTGAIDPPDNLRDQPVWLFSGGNDGVVRRPVMRALETFYRRLVPDRRVFLQDSYPAGHIVPARGASAACTDTGGLFLGDCGYDAAGELLQHLYGRLQVPTAGAPAGRLLEFDQRPFVEGSLRASGMADRGYLFLPQRCEAGQPCRIHIAFHGCRQNAATIGTAFVEQAGYNAWAAANGIVVLYPQTANTYAMPVNPKGCWDWWGYTGAGYASKQGAQVRAVRAMLAKLTRPGSGAGLPLSPAGMALLSGEAADDALTVRWPFTYAADEVWLVEGGERRLVARPAAADTVLALRNLVPGRTYLVEAILRPRAAAAAAGAVKVSLSMATRPPVADCDTYFADNVRHVMRGRASAWWGRAQAAGSGDDLGWWTAWSESQVTRTPAGFRRGVCR